MEQRLLRPFKPAPQTEYVWFSIPDNRLLLLPMKPAPGREDVPHDLQVDWEIEIMELYFIGDF